MKKNPSELSRRKFIKVGAAALASLPFVGFSTETFAAPKAPAPLPAGEQAVAEDDPVASALGYHKDAKKTDFEKYPQRKLPAAKSQACGNCSLFTSVNASWGKCQMLTSGLVSSQGWCGSYSKKS